jgi:hypothetical protein
MNALDMHEEQSSRYTGLAILLATVIGIVIPFLYL